MSAQDPETAEPIGTPQAARREQAGSRGRVDRGQSTKDASPGSSTLDSSREQTDSTTDGRLPSLVPSSFREMNARAQGVYFLVDQARRAHEARTLRWSQVSTWTKLIVAVVAAVSAVSLIADNATLTAVLAITTAVASAISAAVDPARRASEHTRAARDLRREERIAQQLGLVTSDLDENEATLDPGDQRTQQLLSTLVRLEEAVDSTRDQAPFVGRLNGDDPDFDYQRIPRTDHGVKEARA